MCLTGVGTVSIHLKEVKAGLKPNLHKPPKTVIAFPRFGLIFAEL